jgi:hypothetical protein
VGVSDGDSEVVGDVDKPVAGKVQGPACHVERAEGGHRWHGHPETSQLGDQEPMLEGRVVGDEERTVQSGQEVPRDEVERGGVLHVRRPNSMDVRRADVACAWVDEGGPPVLDGAVATDPHHGDLHDAVRDRGQACGLEVTDRVQPRVAVSAPARQNES